MSRITDPDVLAELDQPTVRPLLLAALDFPSGMLRLHTSIGPLVWGGNTYQGVGSLAGVSAIKESTALGDDAFELSLNGVDPSLVASSLTLQIQNRTAQLWLAFLSEAGAVIGSPVGPWVGRMEPMKVRHGAEPRIAIRCDNRLADWFRPRVRRYTHADQTQRHPNDRGFEFVSRTTDIELIWGPTPS